jgi:3,4-dihydroxy 2-butanone 4-phosphate synthase/GTP cyclohydrolase II
MLKKSKDKKRSRRKTATLQMVAQAKLPTRYGDFTIYGFKGHGALDEAVALVRGDVKSKTPPLVRVHSQCFIPWLRFDAIAGHNWRCRCGRSGGRLPVC